MLGHSHVEMTSSSGETVIDEWNNVVNKQLAKKIDSGISAAVCMLAS